MRARDISPDPGLSRAADPRDEILQLRLHGPADAPTLIYLPGLHGDWTLVTPFRSEIHDRLRFVEFTYPQSLTWTLEDYAGEILSELQRNGISSGWLLAESFGSQVAWALVRALSSASSGNGFQLQGVILAGGFVDYPLKWGAHWLAERRTFKPRRGRSLSMWLYAFMLRIRFCRTPGHCAAAREFLARRTPHDALAMLRRIRLLVANDPSDIAASLAVPLFYLTGFFDPIVPWFLVRPRLRALCPSLRSTRIIATADHNVLGTAPRSSVRQIIKWISQPNPPRLNIIDL